MVKDSSNADVSFQIIKAKC